MKNILVTKRNGEKEEFNILKVKRSIAYACEGTTANPLELESRIDYFVKNGIKTQDIQSNIVQHALQLASASNPEWLMVAGHAFAMDEFHSFLQKGRSFKQWVKHACSKGVWTKQVLDYYTDEDIDTLGRYIDYNRDLNHSYASLLTSKQKYQHKSEINQILHMGNAMRFGQAEPEETRMEFVKAVYDVLSTRKFSLATPFMLNLRSGGNTASCFIVAIEDDLDSIFDNVKRVAQISKNGGGIGIFLGYLRAKGSIVNGNENAAGSIVQWIKILNDTLVAVNQGGKRSGAGTVALPIWHNDLFDFLNMQTEHGDIRMKAYDVFPQITVPDVFMERDKNQQQWVLFCPFEVKQKLGIDVRGLYGEDFTKAYLEIEKAAEQGKLKVFSIIPNARDIMKQIMRIQFETGLPYIAFTDRMNEANPNKGDKEAYGIPCANLCVAPWTKILTDAGYITIGEHEGEKVNVWNGEEYSEVEIVKTGTNQKLIKVVTSSGQELECTEYHKFYVVTDYKGTVVEKRAYELKQGDKLIKLETPVVQGHKTLDFAYDNGFFTADGCQEKYSRIYLYDQKILLKDKMKSVSKWNGDGSYRLVGNAFGLKDKFFVPTSEYTIESRLEWLAGLFDGDGTVARNGTNESLQLVSINKPFLLELQMMLQTLGVQTKVVDMFEEGMKMLPLNNGSGESGEYFCQKSWRILISSSALYKLSLLGFKTYRLKWEERLPQRNAEQFVKVKEVIDEGVFADTYCFTEPKRHLGVFNGLLTGQCTESYSNVKPDVYGHVCNLGSINMGNIKDFDDLAYVSRMACRILNRGVDLTKNPNEITEAHNKRYRTIGIGVMGLHDYFAREYKTFDDLETISDIFEVIEYNAALESVDLAKTHGTFEAYDVSEWKNGNMTKRFASHGGKCDWGWLQQQIDEHGIFNSQLTSPAPTTSTSIYQDASASVQPVFKNFFAEDNKNGLLKVASRFLQDNPIGYMKTQSQFDAKEIIDAVAEMQKWVDTGISMELMFDQNKQGFNAKDLYDAIHYAFDKRLKTIYYIRSVKEREDDCVACSG